MLFNAISQQQKHKNEEEKQESKGKKKRKARSDEMTKQEFMDRLKGGQEQEWKVFKDDYVHELAEENEWEEELE